MPDPEYGYVNGRTEASKRRLLITAATTTAFTAATKAISTLLHLCLTLFCQFVEFSHLLFG